MLIIRALDMIVLGEFNSNSITQFSVTGRKFIFCSCFCMQNLIEFFIQLVLLPFLMPYRYVTRHSFACNGPEFNFKSKTVGGGRGDEQRLFLSKSFKKEHPGHFGISGQAFVKFSLKRFSIINFGRRQK